MIKIIPMIGLIYCYIQCCKDYENDDMKKFHLHSLYTLMYTIMLFA